MGKKLLLYEIKQRSKQIVGPLLAVGLLGYFIYHVIQGDRSLLAWFKIHKELEEVTQKLKKVRDYKDRLAHRVSLLRPESLDPDMLEEQVRKNLGYAHPDDLIVPQQPNLSEDEE